MCLPNLFEPQYPSLNFVHTDGEINEAKEGVFLFL